MSGWVDRREKADDAEKRIMKIRRYHRFFRVRELTIRTIKDSSGECIAIRRGAEGQERLVGGYQEDLRARRGGQRRRGVLRRSASGFGCSLGLGTVRLRQAGKQARIGGVQQNAKVHSTLYDTSTTCHIIIPHRSDVSIRARPLVEARIHRLSTQCTGPARPLPPTPCSAQRPSASHPSRGASPPSSPL